MTEKKATAEAATDTIQLPANGRSTLRDQGKSILDIVGDGDGETTPVAEPEPAAEPVKVEEPQEAPEAELARALPLYREEILDQASDKLGNREEKLTGARGDAQRVADALALVFNHPVSPEQAALALAAIDIARLAQNPNSTDTWASTAANAAIGGEITEEKSR